MRLGDYGGSGRGPGGYGEGGGGGGGGGGSRTEGTRRASGECNDAPRMNMDDKRDRVSRERD